MEFRERGNMDLAAMILLQTHPRLVMFAQNICLLVFLLLIAIVAVFLLVATWTGANIFAWKSSQRKAELEAIRASTDRFGNPLPPASRGICETCMRVAEDILHLSNGRRSCRDCYDAAMTHPPTQEQANNRRATESTEKIQ